MTQSYKVNLFKQISADNIRQLLSAPQMSLDEQIKLLKQKVPKPMIRFDTLKMTAEQEQEFLAEQLKRKDA